jgi:4-hydroxy-tetrahydrodipicolinate synthase
MAIFTGAGVAIVTPFHADGSVNYNKLEELIDFQCNNGTDSIVICGTTGESATLSEAEHVEVIKKAVEFTKGRIPVIAGTGSNNTKTAIELSKEAEAAGADGLLMVTPYYNKATQQGLVAHYEAVAKEVKLPIILYSVASRTGCNIEPATVATMFNKIDNIVGIKEASGNISQIAKIMNLTDGKIDLYSGNDDQIVPIMSLGGIGVISVLSNVAPQETHDICAKFMEGDLEGSRALQLKAIPLVDALFCEVNPIPVKKALNLMGYEVGGLRLPLTELTEGNTEKLAKAMRDVGIL